ncbi:SapC family protein [Sphingomonas aestuarii]
MASAPQNQLPILYNDLMPLSSVDHADYRVRAVEKAPQLAKIHAVPLTVEEFPLVQRRMPIVFSEGDDAIPLVLMGLNEGVNTFIDDEGALIEQDVYVPAYIRRYPYMLARLRPDSEEMSLCFDPTADSIGAFSEGEALFSDGQPTEVVQNILKFSEQFEQAGQRTAQFMKELRDAELLMAGEVAITVPGQEQPFIYRGFQMVNEEKLRDMRGDQLRKMNQNGMLPLIYAHLMSLSQMSEVFNRQQRQGKGPQIGTASQAQSVETVQ